MIPGAAPFGGEGKKESLPPYIGSGWSESGELEGKVADNGWLGNPYKGYRPSHTYVHYELL